MIDLNLTVFVQLVNFLITLVVLNILLVSPIRDSIRKRRDHMAGLRGTIADLVVQNSDSLAVCEASLATARQDATSLRAGVREKALLEERVLLDAATEEARSARDQGRSALFAESDEALALLRRDLSAFAQSATAKLLD